jgi:putative ABC transport system permease protein
MLRIIKQIWRTLMSDRQFTFLNIAGLSTGLACSLLIFFWVQDEKSMDHFNTKDDRLYQVIKTWIGSDSRVEASMHTPGMMASTLKSELPQIEYAVPVVSEREKALIGTDAKMIKAAARYAGTEFFDVFTYYLVDGDKSTVLKDLKAVLLSEETARAIFNTTKGIVGKVIKWQTGDEVSGLYTVSGVFATPTNASDKFDVILSYQNYYNTFVNKYGLDRWDSNNPSTYLILKPGTDVLAFNEKIKNYSRNKMEAALGPEALQYEGQMYLQKFSDTYLFNQYENGKISGGRISFVRLFSIIAIIIMIIACINFMNLATAKSASRIKEAGIRKMVGADRGQLILRYFAESTFMSVLSLVFAIGIVYLLLPPFRLITGKELEFVFDFATLITLTGITLATGILAGIYPAIYLTSFKASWVLKKSQSVSGGQSLVRKGLVVFQFALSVIFIVAVMIVYRQMKLVQDKSLGFEKNNVISFTAEGRVKDEMPSFLAELRKTPGVINASGMEGDFVGDHSGGGGIDWQGKTHGIEFAGDYVNTGWIETFQIPVIEGRSFKEGIDSNAVLFNETAIRMMGLKNPIGSKITMWGRVCTLIGVMKDFHYESLYHKPGPYFVRYQPINVNVVAKIDAANIPATLDRVKAAYQKFNNGVAFEYKFIDDDFQKLYAAEQRVSELSKYFAGLAVLISCLGLFGLAAFTAQKRKKEIGVRKVLGATVGNITMMLTSNFVRLVAISLLIAFPLSWWLMNRWLMDFQYRIDITADIFVYASVATLLITLVTISFQAIKASLANPVNSLRNE